ncbi:MAG: microcin C ABC transporter permease YejB [Desulforegulaceae bacterium]|jgi:microcin C transport system permease protein|nr:microcin C ABC transporter permease YejB [Desulforegulaceae bacterium]
MGAYILRRLFLLVPTLIGIIAVNFFIIQAAPGGPVEQMIAKLESGQLNTLSRVTGDKSMEAFSSEKQGLSTYRGSRGVDPELIKELEVLYGFDKPLHQRFFKMLKDFLSFDFGESFYKNKKVITLIKEKLPVSVSLGIWSTLIIYLVSIPLGIKKAVSHGSKFDIYTSTFITIGHAIPVFLFAVLLIILFAGGNYFDIFPLKGLTSVNFDELGFFGKIKDYLSHIFLPVLSLSIGGFATLTLLTKNSFLDEIHKQYVITARAKGLDEKSVLYGHVFRNAMLIIIAGFPSAFIGMFFSGSLLIEVIFSLDGLGLLGFESAITRDYPVMFGSLYIFTLLGLLIRIISDLTYTFVDPRIDFETRTG